MKQIFVFHSAVVLKNQQSDGMNKSSDRSDDSKPSGSEDGCISEGELLLQVGEQQATMFLFLSPCCRFFDFQFILTTCAGKGTTQAYARWIF